jgi:hypothetical protein
VEYAAKFDNAHFTTAEIGATKAEMDAAFDQLDRGVIEALEYAADNIRRYHEEQLPGVEHVYKAGGAKEKVVMDTFDSNEAMLDSQGDGIRSHGYSPVFDRSRSTESLE